MHMLAKEVSESERGHIPASKQYILHMHGKNDIDVLNSATRACNTCHTWHYRVHAIMRMLHSTIMVDMQHAHDGYDTACMAKQPKVC